ncbi:MAG: diguanylate cyclase [Burkholderiaceae bacterium]
MNPLAHRLRSALAAARPAVGRRWRAWLLLALWVSTAAFAQPRAEALLLDASSPRVDAWPALRMMREPAGSNVADAAAARAAWQQRDRFTRPDTPYANLGPYDGVTWLRVPLRTGARAAPAWTLYIDYALMHDLRLSVFDADGTVVHEDRLGSTIAFAQRGQRTRALSSVLALQPGRDYELLLRVVTPTGQLLRLQLLQAGEVLADESATQAFQGLMSGLWLFMLAYSLVAWFQRRQTVFVAYAGSLVASWLFAQAIYGQGARWLWPHAAWPSANLGTLSPLLVVSLNSLFFIGALDMRRRAPRAAWLLLALGACGAVAGACFALGWMSYRHASSAAMLLGLLHLLAAVPVAHAAWRGGDRSAGFVLAGCWMSIVGYISIIALLRGHVAVNFLSMHMVQLASVGEMICWLLALGVRVELLRAEVDRAQRENQALHDLANTDPLTGLHNRRGFEAALRARLHRRGAQGLALFLLDLDGFKQINDHWGHDAGDRLLREVGERLAQAVRAADLVARLGGDEFVLACEVGDRRDAEAVGRKLLEQFAVAFDLGPGRHGNVGATVGYALAAEHGADAAALLRAADAAMYAGKQAGKHRLVAAAGGARATASTASTA